MAWRFYDEAVDMVERRHKHFPRAFRWRGQCYRVDAVERHWTRRRQRHFFQVRCAEGVFELYQDIGTATWHLRRARLSPRQGAAWNRVVPACR